MYTCPTDDIHSVYLDGELPTVYLQQYEAHTKNCAGCAKKLESLRAVRKLLRKDSDALTLDAIAMEESFKRHKAALFKKYRKSIRFPEKSFDSGRSGSGCIHYAPSIRERDAENRRRADAGDCGNRKTASFNSKAECYYQRQHHG